MQRTIESIAKKRVKNADRKAKKREIERASLTVEEYAMKNKQRITLHRRKKQLEKYIITVNETWKIKSPPSGLAPAPIHLSNFHSAVFVLPLKTKRSVVKYTWPVSL